MYKTLTKRALMTVGGLTAGLLAAAIASPVAPAAGASSSGCAPSSADAVVAWNDTASAALGTDAALPAPVMAVGMAYVQAAVYNAVEGIERSHPLYRWHTHAPPCASTAAAVAAAARGVLLHYFPVSSPRVGAAYADALASIPDGAAKDDGVAYGERAANHLLTQRAGDGWLGTTIFDLPPAPGTWRPTPPLLMPYLAPWLGTMTPFVLRNAGQFRPSGPPRLTSATYTRDFREVADLGSATSTTRTAEQTEIALFFAGNLTSQLQGAYRDHVVRHGLDGADAAQYFAIANLAAADAVMAAWDAKLHFGFWRPVTAIRLGDTDGNPGTQADPTWTPLIVTPPFPDYLSGHTTVIGSVTAALTGLEGTQSIDLNLSSTVTGTTRHYATANTLRQEGIGARIWGGIHFRTADETGDRVGRQIGAAIVDRICDCRG
ncbi:vanadium-dependent haloperoxidase [Nocardioides sp.]|jgi:hypothetical protein|uniref:vanadium-dependent haloperoxidase n=1 Tax=Nocardioides sp. TaxID=35761 RepID=UPI002F400E19